ncbi:MAG: glycoside hydrolase [Herbinix sp.]|nr:glycoside hydrolase [Herbinix sp.]
MREQFQKDLVRSGFLHRPLPLHQEGALEKELESRTVLYRKTIWNKVSSLQPHHEGEGHIRVDEIDEELVLSLTGKPITYCWPEAMSPDGDCAFYGTVHAKFQPNHENWEEFHCLTFWVKPECEGARIVNLNLGIKNEGNIKVPDEYYREGTHVVNLMNHQWNRCSWEFGSMARDVITELDFSCRLNGKDTSTGEEVCFRIKDITLETLAEPEPDKGWLCHRKGIAYSTSGYFLTGEKKAITAIKDDEFFIINDVNNEVIFEGTPDICYFQEQEYRILDFSDLSIEGNYRIQIGDTVTKAFSISEEVYEEALWKVLNFLFCERCGYPVPEKHGLCHQDVVARHGDKTISFGGGWHDAGDMSQQLIHTAEVAQALLEMANAVKERKLSGKGSVEYDQTDIDFTYLLYERLVEEALWGLEFTMKSRFGDGHRATSAGLVRWTNGMIGDEDDVEVRCHNHAFENLLCSGICVVASKLLKETDSELAWKCLEIAKEDYTFGIKRWDQVGMELPIMWEHTYSSSKSQYYALITWTSSLLYESTGIKEYGDTAVRYGNLLLHCQETEGKAAGFAGYFYRDEQKQTIVHYSHQSREYMFVQAFDQLCKSLPDHNDKPKWEKAMLLYGEYLKKLMQYASPYEMIPAGIYQEQEAQDKETFEILHLLVNHEEQKEHYINQLKQGVALGDGYYIRNFPVWFSFRGNTAIHLAMAKAAAIVGGYYKDAKLIQLAKEQLYWVSGKNPFRQSMIYGEGDRFAQQYAVMPGEMTGELPVGIQTNEDEDIPYWPHNNNATYKEVWTSSACRWLWTLASIYQGDTGKEIGNND